MKKFYFFAALIAGTVLTSCTSEDDLALSPPEVNVEDAYAPIVFSSVKNNITRGDITGAAAADSLNRRFVVFGYKGTETGTPGSTVFDNYLVEWTENTANTTESNSSNWEYVGKGPIKHATDNGITKQTIKYWDYSQAQYDFIAWSTGSKEAIYEGTPTTGKVLVSEITPQAATSPATGLGAAYTFEGEAEDLKDCYIADLVTVYKAAKTGTDQTYNAVYAGYQQPVTLRFRQLGTKVRIGIYETVPGYSVKDVKFYSEAANKLLDEEDATNGEANAAENASAKIFTTVANGIYKEGVYTVTFPTVDEPTNADNNQAHIDFAPKANAAQKTTVDWGGLNYTFRESGEKSEEAIYLGRSSNTASFAGDADANYYVVYLPNQNGTNLNLRVNFTLESVDGSGETIEVKGSTAQVPSIYAAWKPGYAYTYLFKISDKTNGFTGPYDPEHPDDLSYQSDPAGLYPITFDAIVVNAEEDATQETITTISNPSITTYQKGSNVVNQNEYDKATGPIFVTVNDGNEETTPDLANGKVVTLTKTEGQTIGNAALYTLPTDKAYTEADVISALQLQDDDAEDGTVKGRSGLVLTEADFDLVTSIEYGVDGNAIDLTEIPAGDATYSANAMKFTAANAGTYAFVYTKKASTGETNMYQAVTKGYDDPDTDAEETAESVDGLYRYKLVAATANQDVEKGVIYFENENASTAAITAFLGQNVDNLFTRTGTGANDDPFVYTPARGYAQTGTTYYYTLNGQDYIEAHSVAYASFDNSLYVWDETANNGEGDYVENPDAKPVKGTAYYYKNASDDYIYCVIMPQRTNGLYVIQGTDPTVDANFVACGANDTAVKGMTYFDMYSQNDGVYYTKIIKVVAE
jgi:hypothetical protein